jgi:hypothetical protein
MLGDSKIAIACMAGENEGRGASRALRFMNFSADFSLILAVW